jgi:glycosyltransferase involved in cell wall biosynthesis
VQTPRDAIVVSGWKWETFNVPERMALALAHAGSRVLYCENPASFLRTSARPIAEMEPGVFVFAPRFLGHRINSIPLLPEMQARLLAHQILKQAMRLKLRNPLFIYPHGEYCLTLCREFKRRGFRLVHICMDYHLTEQMEHVRASDQTLAIPQAAFEELRRDFNGKVSLLPQFATMHVADRVPRSRSPEGPETSSIARPRLGYLGNVQGRISLAMLFELLAKHPDWQFLSFGLQKSLMLPNEHVLSWRSQSELPGILDALDVGLLPYDCSDPKNLHCVPLKLFDYFARGMPVVSTPIVYLRQYEDIVYLGSTADELAEAIIRALEEPFDSPKRAKRMAIAEEHSIENLSTMLGLLLSQ